MGWREAALDEARGLKPHFLDKYHWRPTVVETDDAVDVVVRLQGRRLAGRGYALRLRYQADWQVAGRREAFVDPDDHARCGLEHWPPDQAIRGVNPSHRPQPAGPVVPCICLRGVYGYHSVLHANERPTGATLLGFLLELQAVIDE